MLNKRLSALLYGENMTLYNLSVTQQGTCCSSGCGMMEWRFLYDRENKFAINYTNEVMYKLGLPQLDAEFVPEATVEVLEDLLQKHEAGKKDRFAVFAHKVGDEALESIGPLVQQAYESREKDPKDANRIEVATQLKQEMTKLGYLKSSQIGCSE